MGSFFCLCCAPYFSLSDLSGKLSRIESCKTIYSPHVVSISTTRVEFSIPTLESLGIRCGVASFVPSLTITRLRERRDAWRFEARNLSVLIRISWFSSSSCEACLDEEGRKDGMNSSVARA